MNAKEREQFEEKVVESLRLIGEENDCDYLEDGTSCGISELIEVSDDLCYNGNIKFTVFESTDPDGDPEIVAAVDFMANGKAFKVILNATENNIYSWEDILSFLCDAQERLEVLEGSHETLAEVFSK